MKEQLKKGRYNCDYMAQINTINQCSEFLKELEIKPLPKIYINKIHNDDCINLIDEMIENKIVVDAIITDPPYNISRKNNFNTIGRKGIYFGNWDKGFDQLKWLENIDKILSKNGSLIIFNDWKNMGLISSFLEQKGFIIKDLIRLIKPNPMPRNVNRRYVTDYEWALWATKKNSKWTFNKEKQLVYKKPEYIGTTPIGENRIHPTQKPKNAIIELIKTHTNEGDIIFDPFSGSGEISLRALELKRKFIGCEINKTYYKNSLKRFEDYFPKPAFNHIGNKYRIISHLVNMFNLRSFNDFADVFAGSGIVSNYANFAKKIHMNEKDKNVFLLLQYLSSTSHVTLIRDIKKIIKNYNLPIDSYREYKKEFNKLKDDYNYKNKNDIVSLFVLVLYGFNMQIRFNSHGYFNIPCGKWFWTEYQEKKIIQFIKNFKNFNIENISITNLDFETFVNDVDKLTNSNKEYTLYFFDPPYFITDATYNNFWNENDEKRLYRLLTKMTANNINWIMTNQLISKGVVNKYLLNFLISNKNKIQIFNSNVKYINSSYQRKKIKKDIDLEIIVRSFR